MFVATLHALWFSSSSTSMRLICIQYSITFTPSFGVLRNYLVNVRSSCPAHLLFLFLLCVIAFNIICAVVLHFYSFFFLFPRNYLVNVDKV